MSKIVFRPYCRADYQDCIDIFDANCPAFFAPNERKVYERFLEEGQEGYEICEADGRICDAFGLSGNGRNEKRLNWILLDPGAQGIGIGLRIMERVIHLGRKSETRVVKIAASQESAPFFAKYGATTISTTKDGWGAGMDRVDMVLPL